MPSIAEYPNRLRGCFPIGHPQDGTGDVTAATDEPIQLMEHIQPTEAAEVCLTCNVARVESDPNTQSLKPAVRPLLKKALRVPPNVTAHDIIDYDAKIAKARKMTAAAKAAYEKHLAWETKLVNTRNLLLAHLRENKTKEVAKVKKQQSALGKTEDDIKYRVHKSTKSGKSGVTMRNTLEEEMSE